MRPEQGWSYIACIPTRSGWAAGRIIWLLRSAAMAVVAKPAFPELIVAIRRVIPTLLLPLCLACGDDGDGDVTTEPGPGGVPNIAGFWNFSETLNDNVHSISCNNSGTFNISQSGSTFGGTSTQTGTCTGPGGVADNSGSVTISNGQISGNRISFREPFCQYEGTISGSPPNRLSGTSSCSVSEAGVTFNFTGSWEAMSEAVLLGTSTMT